MFQDDVAKAIELHMLILKITEKGTETFTSITEYLPFPALRTEIREG